MPDIWLSIMMLSVVLIFLEWPLRRSKLIIYSLLFVGASLTHHSHLLEATVLLIVTILIKLVFRKRTRIFKNPLKLFVLWCFLAWMLAPAINSFYGEGFRISKAKWVPLTARLIHEGILQDYLKESCVQNDFILCPYQDNLPKDCIDFLWGQSALYEGECINAGWDNCWIQKNDEFGRIINAMIKNQAYFKRIVKMSFTSTCRQLFDFNIGIMTDHKKIRVFMHKS